MNCTFSQNPHMRKKPPPHSSSLTCVIGPLQAVSELRLHIIQLITKLHSWSPLISVFQFPSFSCTLPELFNDMHYWSPLISIFQCPSFSYTAHHYLHYWSPLISIFQCPSSSYTAHHYLHYWSPLISIFQCPSFSYTLHSS